MKQAHVCNGVVLKRCERIFADRTRMKTNFARLDKYKGVAAVRCG